MNTVKTATFLIIAMISAIANADKLATQTWVSEQLYKVGTLPNETVFFTNSALKTKIGQPITATNIGAVASDTTIAGKSLSGDVTLGTLTVDSYGYDGSTDVSIPLEYMITNKIGNVNDILHTSVSDARGKIYNEDTQTFYINNIYIKSDGGYIGYWDIQNGTVSGHPLVIRENDSFSFNGYSYAASSVRNPKIANNNYCMTVDTGGRSIVRYNGSSSCLVPDGSNFVTSNMLTTAISEISTDFATIEFVSNTVNDIVIASNSNIMAKGIVGTGSSSIRYDYANYGFAVTNFSNTGSLLIPDGSKFATSNLVANMIAQSGASAMTYSCGVTNSTGDLFLLPDPDVSTLGFYITNTTSAASSHLTPDGSDFTTSNMVENMISGISPSESAKKTYAVFNVELLKDFTYSCAEYTVNGFLLLATTNKWFCSPRMTYATNGNWTIPAAYNTAFAFCSIPNFICSDFPAISTTNLCYRLTKASDFFLWTQQIDFPLTDDPLSPFFTLIVYPNKSYDSGTEDWFNSDNKDLRWVLYLLYYSSSTSEIVFEPISVMTAPSTTVIYAPRPHPVEPTWVSGLPVGHLE